MNITEEQIQQAFDQLTLEQLRTEITVRNGSGLMWRQPTRNFIKGWYLPDDCGITPKHILESLLLLYGHTCEEPQRPFREEWDELPLKMRSEMALEVNKNHEQQ
jgi:hypothetical protein